MLLPPLVVICCCSCCCRRGSEPVPHTTWRRVCLALSAAPPAANMLSILRVIMDTYLHDLWLWAGGQHCRYLCRDWTCLGTAATWVGSSRPSSTTALRTSLHCTAPHSTLRPLWTAPGQHCTRIPPWPAHGSGSVRTRLTPELFLGHCDTDSDQQGTTTLGFSSYPVPTSQTECPGRSCPTHPT